MPRLNGPLPSKTPINASAAYREAAQTWEGDFWCIVEPEAGRPESTRKLIIWGLWRDVRRKAFWRRTKASAILNSASGRRPKNCRRVLQREVDPIKALMANQLKLKGNLAKIVRSVRAAQEWVWCAARVPTQFL
ncbi:hypothetical protein [Candidatus Roseilinea sp. NK_OTU-006]|uniref:hypothetical protein n=1 Tax=Candidatus Roseilinea sp. NK_OTU-006 TaxID=2704250 RepID=UPI00145C86D1|nr:hypothetical protein [Candidatus Roseilinea sp. NK_OTU-006]